MTDNPSSAQADFQHTSVLWREIAQSMQLLPGDIAVDCTAGGGGHTHLLLEQVGTDGKVFAFDQDIQAIHHLEQRFQKQIASGNLTLIHKNFSHIRESLEAHGVFGQVKAIIADLGVSSVHLDHSDRGFSFRKEGPLDMRMDQSQPTRALDLIQDLSEHELAHLIWIWGEEKFSKRIAKKIVEWRNDSLEDSTTALAQIIEEAYPKIRKPGNRIHPATLTFQALRIAVNQELQILPDYLKNAESCLAAKGRLGIIAFHSLEDRLVKRFMKAQAGRNENPATRDLFLKEAPHSGKIIKPFPVKPSKEEMEQNPRSRSSRLRVFEKL